MTLYRRIVEKSSYLLFLAVAFTITFPPQFVRILWGIWIVSWFLEGRFMKREYLKLGRENWPTYLFGTLFLALTLSLLWAISPKEANQALERQISYIILPIIALFGFNTRYKPKQIMTAFVGGATFTALAYFFVIFYIYNFQYYFGYPQYTISYSGMPFDFYADVSSVIKHRFYHCTLLLVAFLMLIYLKGDLIKRYGKSNAYLIIAFISTIILGTIWMTGSRASILTIGILCALYVGRRLIRKGKIAITIVSAVMIIGISFAVLFSSPRMNNVKINDLLITSEKPADPQMEPRVYIWQVALKELPDYILTGKGAGSTKSFMAEQYKRYDMPEFYSDRRFNTHNQYLETCVELGFGGLILLLVALLSNVYVAQRKSRVFVIYFTTLLLFNLLFDSLLSRSDGVVLICLMNILFILMNRKEEQALAHHQHPIMGATPELKTSEEV